VESDSAVEHQEASRQVLKSYIYPYAIFQPPAVIASSNFAEVVTYRSPCCNPLYDVSFAAPSSEGILYGAGVCTLSIPFLLASVVYFTVAFAPCSATVHVEIG
jgi:hypothetical protein